MSRFTPGNTLSGRKVVAVAGTAERLSTDTAQVVKVTITAETDNAGVVVVGDSAVVAALGTRKGVPLSAGDAYDKEIAYLGKVWLDTTVSGDGVTWDADVV